MKRLAIVAVFCLAAAVGWAGSFRVLSKTTALTFTPTVGDFLDGGGFDLSDVRGFRVRVCAPDGGPLLSGSCPLTFYHFNGVDVAYNKAMDTTLTETTQCAQTQDFETVVPAGSLIVGTNGCTTTDAGTVTIRVSGYTEMRR